MSHCQNCGSRFTEREEKFCSVCGFARTGAKVQHLEKPEKSPSKKGRYRGLKIALTVIIIVAIAAAVLMVFAKDEIDNLRGVYDDSKQAHNHAKTLMDDGEYVEAIKQLQTVEPGYKYYKDALDLLGTATAEYKNSVISDADELVKEEEFSKALALLESVYLTLPEDKEVTKKIDQINLIYKNSFLAKSEEYIKLNNFPDAIATLETALGTFPNDNDLTTALVDVHKTKILNKVAEFEEAKDYGSAITYVKSELRNVNNHEEITAKLNSLIANYKSNLMADADTALKQKGYNEAVAILRDGLAVLNNDSDILKKIEEYEAYRPVPLWDFPVLSSGSFSDDVFSEVSKDLTDVLGNVYESPIGIKFDGEDYQRSYRTISIQGNYNYLSGTFFIREKTSTSHKGYIKLLIYGDDTLIKSVKLYRADNAQYFKVKITGYKTISIGVDGYVPSIPIFNSIYAGIADLVVGK